MNIKSFDLEIQSKLKKLITYANQTISGRSWHVETTFWEDGDYRIILISNWGDIRDSFEYKKSYNTYIYEQQKYAEKQTPEWYEVLKEKTLK